MEDVTCLDQLVTYVLLDGEAVLTETCIDPLTEADLLGRAARRGCWLAITVGGAFFGRCSLCEKQDEYLEKFQWVNSTSEWQKLPAMAVPEECFCGLGFWLCA